VLIVLYTSYSGKDIEAVVLTPPHGHNLRQLQHKNNAKPISRTNLNWTPQRGALRQLPWRKGKFQTEILTLKFLVFTGLNQTQCPICETFETLKQYARANRHSNVNEFLVNFKK